MHLRFKIILRIFLLTLAPRAYVTHYQARGLSGHTSPCDEHACLFLKICTFRKSKVGTLHRKRNIFSQEHHAFFEQLASSMMMLIKYIQIWSKYRCNCLGNFHVDWRRQVLLVEEAQDGVLLHNTWCSGTSCGGINPYTLTARLGPGGLTHYETNSKAWSDSSEFRARKQDVEIKQDSSRVE